MNVVYALFCVVWDLINVRMYAYSDGNPVTPGEDIRTVIGFDCRISWQLVYMDLQRDHLRNGN